MLWPLLILIVGLLMLLVGAAMCAAHWMEPIPSSAAERWFWLAVVGAVCAVVSIAWLLFLLLRWWLT